MPSFANENSLLMMAELKKSDASRSFSFLARYSNIGKAGWDRMISEAKAAGGSDEEIADMDRAVRQIYDRLHWYNILLLLWAQYEQELYDLCSTLRREPPCTADKPDETLRQMLPNVASVCGRSEWQTVDTQARHVRNAIIHANGRVDRLRCDTAKQIVKDRSVGTVVRHTLYLRPGFVAAVSRAMVTVVHGLWDLYAQRVQNPPAE